MTRLIYVLWVLALAACGSKESSPQATPPTPPAPADAAAPVSPPLIDVAGAARCRASFTCGMSHPGLGTSSNSTTIDLATCERTTASSSGPYEAAPPPDKPPPPPVPVKLDRATCDRIAAAAAAVTKDEAGHHESAHVDSTACSVALVCGDKAIYSVQRQTTEIPDHVSQLIVAIQGG